MTGAGDLNRRLVLEAPVETDDGAGGVTVSGQDGGVIGGLVKALVRRK